MKVEIGLGYFRDNFFVSKIIFTDYIFKLDSLCSFLIILNHDKFSDKLPFFNELKIRTKLIIPISDKIMMLNKITQLPGHVERGHRRLGYAFGGDMSTR